MKRSPFWNRSRLMYALGIPAIVVWAYLNFRKP